MNLKNSNSYGRKNLVSSDFLLEIKDVKIEAIQISQELIIVDQREIL